MCYNAFKGFLFSEMFQSITIYKPREPVPFDVSISLFPSHLCKLLKCLLTQTGFPIIFGIFVQVSGPRYDCCIDKPDNHGECTPCCISIGFRCVGPGYASGNGKK